MRLVTSVGQSKGLFWILLFSLGCSGTYSSPQRTTTAERNPAQIEEKRGLVPGKIEVNELPSEVTSYATSSSPSKEVPKLKSIFIDPLVMAGDTLQCEVAGEEELSGHFLVQNDGMISYPMLKRVTVQGKTLPQLTAELTQALSKYLREPVVNLTVSQWGERKVYVSGSAKGSEVVSLSPTELTTVTRLLIRLGITEEMDLSEISLVRAQAGGGKETFQIPVQELLQNYELERDPVVQTGDLLLIQKMGKVFIQGQVQRPGAYPIGRRQKLTLWSLISLAQGTQPSADLEKIQIIRQTEGHQREWQLVSASLETVETVLVHAHEIVIVPSQVDHFFTIYGEVRKPGTISLGNKKMRLSAALAMAGGVTEFASNRIRLCRYLPQQQVENISANYNAIISGNAEHDLEIQPGDVIYVEPSLW